MTGANLHRETHSEHQASSWDCSTTLSHSQAPRRHHGVTPLTPVRQNTFTSGAQRCPSSTITALALQDANSWRTQQQQKVSWYWVITRMIISTTSLLSDIIFSHKSLLPNSVHANKGIGSEGTRRCPLSGRVSSKQSINAKERQSAVSITAPG